MSGMKPKSAESCRCNAARVPVCGKISVYQVRLRCEAAPVIGCGLRAKPVLEDLERVPSIREAWLNEAGILIAVVKTVAGSGTQGGDPVLAVFGAHRIAVQALRGAQFAKALSDFASQPGWYRGADVDRLSGEEARIIAARLVTRLRTRAALPELQVDAREMAVAEACVHELIRNPTQSPAARKRRLASAVLAAARTRLDAPAYAAFADAVKLGHRPLPDER